MICVVMMCFFSIRRRHTICALVTGVQTCALPIYENFRRSGQAGLVEWDWSVNPIAEVFYKTDPSTIQCLTTTAVTEDGLPLDAEPSEFGSTRSRSPAEDRKSCV